MPCRRKRVPALQARRLHLGREHVVQAGREAVIGAAGARGQQAQLAAMAGRPGLVDARAAAGLARRIAVRIGRRVGRRVACRETVGAAPRERRRKTRGRCRVAQPRAAGERRLLRATAAQRQLDLRRGRAAGHDVHHAPDRLRPMHRGQIAADDLDALDLFRQQMLPGRRAEVGPLQWHAVDQHQGLATVGATQEQRRLRSHRAGLPDVDGGQHAKQRRQIGGLCRLDLLARDDTGGRQGIGQRLFDARCRDGDAGGRCFGLGMGGRPCGSQARQRGQGTRPETGREHDEVRSGRCARPLPRRPARHGSPACAKAAAVLAGIRAGAGNPCGLPRANCMLQWPVDTGGTSRPQRGGATVRLPLRGQLGLASPRRGLASRFPFTPCRSRTTTRAPTLQMLAGTA